MLWLKYYVATYGVTVLIFVVILVTLCSYHFPTTW